MRSSAATTRWIYAASVCIGFWCVYMHVRECVRVVVCVYARDAANGVPRSR